MAADKSEPISIKLGISLPYEHDKRWSGSLSLSNAVVSIPSRRFVITNVAMLLTECIYLWRVTQTVNNHYSPKLQPASCTMSTGSFPGVKSGRGVTLTPHPLLVPWSWKGRAIPLLPVWAVRPVQSLSACTRVHFISLNNITWPLCSATDCVPYEVRNVSLNFN